MCAGKAELGAGHDDAWAAPVNRLQPDQRFLLVVAQPRRPRPLDLLSATRRYIPRIDLGDNRLGAFHREQGEQ